MCALLFNSPDRSSYSSLPRRHAWLAHCGIFLLLLTLVASPVYAQDTAAPLPNGDLLFSANFSKSMDGLAPLYGQDWMAAGSADGRLRVAALTPDSFVAAVVDTLRFGDLLAEVEVLPVTEYADQDYGFLLRGENGQDGLGSFYLVAVEPADGEVHFDLWTADGAWDYLHTEPLPPNLWRTDAFNRLRVEVVGDSVRAFLNDTLVLTAQDATLGEPGTLGLVTSAPADLAAAAQAVAHFDNLRIYAAPVATTAAQAERVPGAKGAKGAASAEVVLTDFFNDPDSGWSTGVTDAGEVAYVGGELHLRNWSTATISTVSWRGLDLADVTVTYTSRWVDGDPDNWHTLLCRRQGESSISAGFSADGYFSAGVRVDGALVHELAPPTASDAIHQEQGAVNSVKLACVGNQIMFWVNETLLVDATDDRLLHGDIGLAASALGGEFTEITFDEMMLVGQAATAGAAVGTVTATVTAAATPSAPPASATVTAAGLNVRSGPGASFDRVERVEAGAVLTVLGRNDACTWLQVLTPRASGWVSAGFVRLNVACDELPLASDETEAAAGPTAAAVATAEPSATPRPTAAAATAAAAATVAAAATAAAASGGPALITDFENFGAWRRGDESWGALTQSSAEAVSGRYAGKITYDFPANVPEGRNYVVFLRALPLPGQPEALTIWVNGDGSGNFLNAWVEDATGQVWQFSFGQIEHSGWRQMTAPLDTSLDWPVQRISGSGGAALTYPLQLQALVLDYPTDDAAAGVIYLDDLATVE